MGNPIPLFERYCPGERYIISDKAHAGYAGVEIEIVEAPLQYAGEDEMVCRVKAVHDESEFYVMLDWLIPKEAA